MDKAQEAAVRRIQAHTVLKAVVADEEESLWNFAADLFPNRIQVLDIIHVRDKPRTVAYLYFKEESPDAQE